MSTFMQKVVIVVLLLSFLVALSAGGCGDDDKEKEKDEEQVQTIQEQTICNACAAYDCEGCTGAPICASKCGCDVCGSGTPCGDDSDCKSFQACNFAYKSNATIQKGNNTNSTNSTENNTDSTGDDTTGETGVCVKLDCQINFVPRDHACTQVSCDTNSTCKNDERCVSGFCNELDCPSNQVAVNHECVDVNIDDYLCESDADCEGTQHCVIVEVQVNDTDSAPENKTTAGACQELECPDGEIAEDHECVDDPDQNAAPNVELEDTMTVALTDSNIQLVANVTDDDLPDPPGTVSVTWSLESGPDGSTIVSPNSATTQVTFTQSGTYVFKIVASDSVLTTEDTITVTVQDGSN